MIQLVALSSASASHGSASGGWSQRCLGRRDAVQVRRWPGRGDGADAVDVGVAEAAGDRGAGRVGDLLDDADEQVGLLQRRRDEHGAAVESRRRAGESPRP